MRFDHEHLRVAAKVRGEAQIKRLTNIVMALTLLTMLLWAVLLYYGWVEPPHLRPPESADVSV